MSTAYICGTFIPAFAKARLKDMKAAFSRSFSPTTPMAVRPSAAAWIYAGGSHHSVLSYDLTAEHMRDFAEIMGIEFVYINKDTKIPEFRKELEYNDVIWRNK